jgi:hypothetical protein
VALAGAAREYNQDPEARSALGLRHSAFCMQHFNGKTALTTPVVN